MTRPIPENHSGQHATPRVGPLEIRVEVSEPTIAATERWTRRTGVLAEWLFAEWRFEAKPSTSHCRHGEAPTQSNFEQGNYGTNASSRLCGRRREPVAPRCIELETSVESRPYGAEESGSRIREE